MTSEEECKLWNARVPIGAEVMLERDNGKIERTKTRGEAFVCASGYAVVFLEGVRGYYLLDRVTASAPIIKQFLYVENCEGGIDPHIVSSPEEMSFLRGWGEVSCEQEDMVLCSFMRRAEVGDHQAHRLGVCIRLKDKTN